GRRPPADPDLDPRAVELSLPAAAVGKGEPSPCHPPEAIPARHPLVRAEASRPDRRRRRALGRSEEHTSELQSLAYLVCRLLLEKKNIKNDCHDQPIAHQFIHPTKRLLAFQQTPYSTPPYQFIHLPDAYTNVSR